MTLSDLAPKRKRESWLMDDLAKATKLKRGPGPAVALTKAIRAMLAMHGWYSWKNGASAMKIGDRFVRTGTPGLPDIMAVKAGKLLCVEVKAGRDTVKPIQADVLGILASYGATVIVARSAGDVLEFLEAKHERPKTLP